MRYYLVFIQYNKDKQAENRTTPKGYDSLDQALSDFHTQLGADMKNSSLGWSLVILFDSTGGIIRDEKWTREE